VGPSDLKDSPVASPTDYDKLVNDWIADNTKQLGEKYTKFMASENLFQDLGENPATLTGVDDIGKRLAALQDALNANKETQAYMKNSDAEYNQYLQRMNAPDDVISKSLATYHKYAGSEKLTPLLESNGKLMADYIRLYSFLQRTYGSWTITNQQIVFKDSPDYAANAQSVTDYEREIDEDTKTNAVLVSGLSDKH
jgi:hypothetical protein